VVCVKIGEAMTALVWRMTAKEVAQPTTDNMLRQEREEQ
jgi:hypothetical protein